MKIFRLLPNLNKWRTYTHPIIDGRHAGGIPNVKCRLCGWIPGSEAIAYPYINPTQLSNRELYEGITAVSEVELERVIQEIRALLPPGVPVFPGASLGPFQGKHKSGALEDFYLYYGLHLLSKTTYERLRECGALSLGATPAQIKGRKQKDTVDYVELHLLPRAELALPKIQEPSQKYCPECGFDQRSLPNPLVVCKSSIPMTEQVFQLKDDPGVKLATETFVEAVKSLGLTGIQFEPVEVA